MHVTKLICVQGMPCKTRRFCRPLCRAEGGNHVHPALPVVSKETQKSATEKVSVRVMPADAMFPYGSIRWDHICTATFKLSLTALTVAA